MMWKMMDQIFLISLVIALSLQMTYIDKSITNDEIFNTLLFEEVTQASLSGFGALPKCGENGLDVCVPYYDCDPITHTVMQTTMSDEYNIIDIETIKDETCDHFLYVCCRKVEEIFSNNISSLNRTDMSPLIVADSNSTSSINETTIEVLGPTTTPHSETNISQQLHDTLTPENDTDGNITHSENYKCGNWSVCGASNSDGISFKLSGDMHNIAQYGEFPWQVLLLKTGYSKKLFENRILCGGSIIQQNIVLTAAHCVKGFSPFEITVRAGEWDTQTTIETIPYQDRIAKRVVIHEDYRDGMNDIALVFLDRPYIKVNSVGTVCLPNSNYLVNYKNCFASGWGKFNLGGEKINSVMLKKIKLMMMANSECQETLRETRLGPKFILHPSMICARGRGIDACGGDEGGPLICSHQSDLRKYIQIGIISKGLGCHTNNFTSTYTDVVKFTWWIKEKLRGAALSSAKNYWEYMSGMDSLQ